MSKFKKDRHRKRWGSPQPLKRRRGRFQISPGFLEQTPGLGHEFRLGFLNVGLIGQSPLESSDLLGLLSTELLQTHPFLLEVRSVEQSAQQKLLPFEREGYGILGSGITTEFHHRLQTTEGLDDPTGAVDECSDAPRHVHGDALSWVDVAFSADRSHLTHQSLHSGKVGFRFRIRMGRVDDGPVGNAEDLGIGERKPLDPELLKSY